MANPLPSTGPKKVMVAAISEQVQAVRGTNVSVETFEGRCRSEEVGGGGQTSWLPTSHHPPWRTSLLVFLDQPFLFRRRVARIHCARTKQYKCAD